MGKLKKIERYLGSAKFAVLIILIFTVFLIVGTFIESYNGTEYANRLIYKGIPFMVVQGLMFLSIFLATLQRFPYKKALAGFYTLHAGLLILFIGSFVTYYSGIDGQITLEPNKPSNVVVLNRDELLIKDMSANKEILYELPYTPFAKNIDFKYENLHFKTYLPYAENKIEWIEDIRSLGRFPSSQYTLKNDRFKEQITVSLNPNSAFKSSTRLGPLSVHYLPINLFKCFNQSKTAKFIIWDINSGFCAPANEQNSHYKEFSFGKDVLIYKDKGLTIPFIPSMSPLPIKIQAKAKVPFTIDQNSSYRVFNRSLFESAPHLFVFGEGVAYYLKDEEKWESQPANIGKAVELPWMGFEITHLKTEYLKKPELTPYYVKPVQDNNQIIKGSTRAIEVVMNSGRTQQSFWLHQGRAQKITLENKTYEIYLKRNSIELPFEINLTRFKMDTDPGTRNPASYESFVNLFTGQDTQKFHIFMNNPMKYENLTFYQASYFPIGEDIFGSVLSVNYDPGRPLKYFGSLLLVLGSMWHFVLRKPKKKKTLTENEAHS